MEEITHINLAIVDDSSTDSETFADLLRHQGITVNVQQILSKDSLDCIDDNDDEIDIVVFSPERSSKSLSQVVEAAMKCKPALPVIVIHSEYQRDSALSALNEGASDYLSIDENDSFVDSLLNHYDQIFTLRKLRSAQMELRSSKETWRKLADQCAQPLAYITEGFFSYINPAFQQLLNNQDLLDLPFMDYVAAQDQAELKIILQKLQQKIGTSSNIDLSLKVSDVKVQNVRAKLTPCVLDGEQSLSVLIEAEKSASKATKPSATTNGNIDFINIEKFLDEVQGAINLAKDTSMGGCIGILEIDDFQAVKDAMGVTVSDSLLEDLSEFIMQSMPSKVNLSRLGNGAFVILLNFIDTNEALTLLEELRIKLSQHKLEISQQTLSLTCSIGLVAVTDKNDSVDELMAFADTAVRVARHHGGNITHLYDPFKDYDLSQNVDQDWKGRIEMALNSGSFRLMFQPITNIKKRPAVHRYEVLVRMLEDEEEILPSQFLHSAKQSGIEHLIDKWVVLNALQQLHTRAKLEQKIELFIKLSSNTIQDNTFPVWLQSMLETMDIGQHRLCFEFDSITCQSLLARMRVFVPDLKNLKANVALEHFGKDKAHFSLLEALQFDYVKIDGSLISHIAHDRRNQITIKQTVEQCKKHNTKIIAVSVQDTNSVSFLWRAGVTNIQGYYVQPPAPTMSFDFDTSI